MLKQILIAVVIVIIAAVLYLWAVGNFKKKSNELTKLVYVDHDFEGYKNVSNSLSCKIFLSKKQRLLLDSAMYDYLKLDDELQSCLNKLNAIKLTDQEFLNVNYMQMKLYIRQNDSSKASALYQQVTEKFQNAESAYIRGIVKEYEFLYYVDYLHDISYLKEIERLANKVDIKYSKALFNIRAAILKKTHNMNYRSNLDKAKELVEEDVLNEILSSIGYNEL